MLYQRIISRWRLLIKVVRLLLQSQHESQFSPRLLFSLASSHRLTTLIMPFPAGMATGVAPFCCSRLMIWRDLSFGPSSLLFCVFVMSCPKCGGLMFKPCFISFLLHNLMNFSTVENFQLFLTKRISFFFWGGFSSIFQLFTSMIRIRLKAESTLLSLCLSEKYF